MQNPKTTIAGYLILAAAFASLIAHLLTGQPFVNDITSLTVALGGLGLIAAKDGGH